MSARFEIVTTDARQPYHVRVVATNGETLLTSENYAAVEDAEHVLILLAEIFGAPEPRLAKPIDNVSRRSTDGGGETWLIGTTRALLVDYLDERA